MNIDHPTSAHIPALRSLFREAFGDSEEFLDIFYSVAFSPDRCLAIWEEDSLAAALYWFDCGCRGHRAAYVYAVATGEAFRGRGLCHALMARLHSLLQEDGYAMAVLVPGSKPLFRLYASMGYEPFGPMQDLSCTAGSEPVPIQEISPEEYAHLRREYLPEGAVLQNGENLAFLQALTRLYAGNGFLLAADVQDGSLFAQELLGDRSAAPGILCCLSCREGHFRVPGGTEPFAMYKALVSCEKPEYFAFAFD